MLSVEFFQLQEVCWRLLAVNRAFIIGKYKVHQIANYLLRRAHSDCFSVIVEEEEEREVVQGDVRRKEWVWVHRFTEQKVADFYLLDPSIPNSSVYIPGDIVPIKLHVNENAVVASGMGGLMSVFKDEVLPPGIQVRT